MEELEKNETSTQAEENTVSLASAQALADALAKIEAYTPTTWVDNSSPDIDAEHLNKPEQAIKRVTDALNSAVDVIKDLQSQVTKNAGAISDVNNNLSNSGIPIVKKITDLYSIKTSGFYYYDAGTTNAPQSSRGGMIIANYLSDSWISLIVVPYASSKIYTNTKYNNTWVGWAESATKDDLAAKLELISSDNLPFKANTIQPNSNVTFTFKPTLPSGYILVGACVKDTKSLDNKVVPVYCNASSSNGTNTINLRLLNISNDVVSITANMGITFYLFVKK